MLTLPGIGFALLPKLACPMCWPVYASVLTSLGLGFLISRAYLLPLTIGFLLIAVGTLGHRAKQRRGHGPFLLGFVASTAVIVGKFHFESNPIMYGGVTVLVIASIWNAWPETVGEIQCPQCSTTKGDDTYGIEAR